MVSFYDPDEDVHRKRVDRQAQRERRERRRERAASLEGEEAVRAAKEAALRQLDRQDRSRGELQAKLCEHGYCDEAINAALDRLEAVGLVDDEKYAQMLVRTRHRERGLVGRALIQQLRQKRISPHVIDQALAQLDDVDTTDQALQLVQRRLRSMAGLDRDTKVRRLVAMLARKGYAPGVCFQVVNEALDQAQDEAEEDADGHY